MPVHAAGRIGSTRIMLGASVDAGRVVTGHGNGTVGVSLAGGDTGQVRIWRGHSIGTDASRRALDPLAFRAWATVSALAAGLGLC